MSIDRRRFLSAGLASSLSMAALKIHGQDRVSGSGTSAVGQQVAATVHPLATQAAIDAMLQGGNAIDAAIVAAAILGVVDGHNSGLGGGCFLLIRTGDGQVVAIDGRETAPADVSPGMYQRDGNPAVELSQTGPLAMGVPGQLAALSLAHQSMGRLPWQELFLPAAKIAKEGYAVGKMTASAIRSEIKDIERFPETARVCLPEGRVPLEGSVLRQPDLARTLEQIGLRGADWFYRGEFANLVAGHVRSLGGVLKADDFAAYRAKWRSPIQSRYRQWRIAGFPPPSSGGVHVAQMLNMLELFPLQRLHATAPDLFFHVAAECMKLAFADRAHWLGDPDFVAVPRGLVHPDYARTLANRIRLDGALRDVAHGMPAAWQDQVFDDRKHTTHLTTADAHGNWVAMTATINTTFGSKVVAPGTGVFLNNQMDDFSLAPGIPNAFGLLGSDANAIAPGKRPLSSMSPTLVMDAQGLPVVSCGAAGGPKIINAVLQILLRCLDLNEPIDQAIAGPRIHHQWSPDRLLHEGTMDPATMSRLAQRGHDCQSVSSLAVAQGIARESDGRLRAASDPRVPSRAAAG
jgi:gamma-glutamyltranspeptidase/glutathione hydrolase